MSLTGTPLIVLAMLATAGTLAATILVWSRGRRLRLPLRTLGVLLTEALLLLSVGLVVNRSQQFYPTWAALLQTGSTTGITYPTAPGHLDRWLREYAGGHPDQSIAFIWQPTGWTGWHLAGAPIIVTPTAYLQHPGWRYSALLVIDNGTTGWTPTAEGAAARSAGLTAGAAIMVFARTTPTTTAHTLVAALPKALARDLRVTGRRWALVASPSDAGLGRQTAAAAPARYPAIALVHGTTPQNPPNANQHTPASNTPAATAAGQHPSRRPGTATPVPPPLPAGIAIAVVGATVAAHPVALDKLTQAAARELAVQPVYLAAGATNALRTALAWACQQTPPPLAASTPAVTYVPIHRRPKHHSPHPSPTGLAPAPGSGAADSPPATIHPGGSHVPGQPGA
jgi:hypothetical protein